MNRYGPESVSTPIKFQVSTMSAVQMLITNIQSLSEAERSAVFVAFGFDASAAKAPKAEKKEKKPRANAGKGTAWSAFSVKIQQDHKSEVDAVKAEAAIKRKAAKDAGEEAPEDTKGAHLHWCSNYKKTHEPEWLAFKAAWELENKSAPVGGSGEDTSDDAATVVDSATEAVAVSNETTIKKRGPKKLADMTPEEQAAAKAKRAAKKAEKTSANASRSPSPKVKGE